MSRRVYPEPDFGWMQLGKLDHLSVNRPLLFGRHGFEVLQRTANSEEQSIPINHHRRGLALISF
ncbi:MAG: hypothetical protein JST80_13015 [Bdellovibrionales bacterium]|nr:hypothetical protein [Bdellovibrionales bacterium]